MQKIRDFLTSKSVYLQIFFFTIAKTCFSLVELPRYKKQQSVAPELIIAIVFYTISISIKIVRHGAGLVRQLPNIIIQSFLLWIVTILEIMFSFALCDSLGWSFLQNSLVTFVQLLQTLAFVLLTNWKFITKRQFIFYQVLLTVNIFGIAYKCIWFLTYHQESDDKDMVLLTLTTQVALSIVIMDIIDRAYNQYRKNKTTQSNNQTNRLQRELTMTNN